MTSKLLNYSLLDEVNDEDDSQFLEEVPLSLIENSIVTQFNEPLEYRKKDYIKEFITKYNYSKENEYTKDLGIIDELRDDFLSFIINIFHDKLDIGLDAVADMGEDEQFDLIHHVYKYFIKGIKKNFVAIVCNEIKENKPDIVATLEKRKDVTYLTFKSEIDNEEDSLTLSNLNIVVDLIFNKIINEYDVDVFFKMSDTGEVNLSKEYIKSKYKVGEITGNFIDKYIKMADDPFFKTEIEAKVRNYILKKYPNRARNTEYLDEEDVEESTEDSKVEKEDSKN